MASSFGMTTPRQQQAGVLRRQFSQQQDEIRRNPNLSAEGRRNQLAAAHRVYAKKMSDLRDADRQEREQAAELAGKTLWKVAPADRVAYNQYLEAADKFTTREQFEQALMRAVRRDDLVHAQALAEAAVDKGFHRTAAAHFHAIGRGVDWGNWAGPAAVERSERMHMRFNESVAFSAPRPAELQGYSDAALENFAGQGDNEPAGRDQQGGWSPFAGPGAA